MVSELYCRLDGEAVRKTDSFRLGTWTYQPSDLPSAQEPGITHAWQHTDTTSNHDRRSRPSLGSGSPGCPVAGADPAQPPDNGRLSGTSAAYASTAMLMARNGHKSTPSLVRTPRCDADSVVTMSHASTSGQRPWCGHWPLRTANIRRARQPDIWYITMLLCFVKGLKWHSWPFFGGFRGG